jgi:hypothetical protein
MAWQATSAARLTAKPAPIVKFRERIIVLMAFPSSAAALIIGRIGSRSGDLTARARAVACGAHATWLFETFVLAAHQLVVNPRPPMAGAVPVVQVPVVRALPAAPGSGRAPRY